MAGRRSRKESLGSFVPVDVRTFIAENLHLRPAPGVPEIRLYTAHPGSGLARLRTDAPEDQPPYWAYSWAGGILLARHLFRDPDIVRGRRVLDLGAGSGIVGIAACKCDASSVIATEIDANAIAAIDLNAAANNVTIEVFETDILSGDRAPNVDIILAGDVFYDAELAGRVLPFLAACRSAGVEVLIGDPRRRSLPLASLRLIAEYAVPDFGDGGAQSVTGGVFTLEA